MTDRTFNLLRDLSLNFPAISLESLHSILERLALDPECAIALGFDQQSESREELERDRGDIEAQRARIQLAATKACNDILDVCHIGKAWPTRRKTLGVRAIAQLQTIALTLL
jgi:hypothetical protein